MLLDTALRIVDPEAFDTEMDELREAVSSQEWGDEHPATAELLAEFDDLAEHRSDDGEAFFPREAALRFIRRCEELDLAIMEMEGLDLSDGELTADQSLVLETAEQPMMTWSQFRGFANLTAQQALTLWPERDTLVIAFVFRQPDGVDIVA